MLVLRQDSTRNCKCVRACGDARGAIDCKNGSVWRWAVVKYGTFLPHVYLLPTSGPQLPGGAPDAGLSAGRCQIDRHHPSCLLALALCKIIHTGARRWRRSDLTMTSKQTAPACAPMRSAVQAHKTPGYRHHGIPAASLNALDHTALHQTASPNAAGAAIPNWKPRQWCHSYGIDSQAKTFASQISVPASEPAGQAR